MNAPTASPGFSERLRVPLRWWAQGSMFVASLWLAMVVSLPGVIAWPATALMVATLIAQLASYGGSMIIVSDDHLQVGRARIESRFLGPAQSLDAEQTRRTAGVEADARAYLMLRPYLKRAVKVAITDPADPAPYWLVSTRHPDELAVAITSMAAAGPADSH